MPGLNGFIGEFLTLLGAFRWDWRFVVGAGLGVILSAVYMLWMFQRVFFGDITHDENRNLPDLHPREWAGVLPLCAMALFMGIFPTLFLRPMEAAVERLVERFQATQSLRVDADVASTSRRKIFRLKPEGTGLERFERIERIER
jgi:NADH-quinone oxidoreductase subunit M